MHGPAGMPAPAHPAPASTPGRRPPVAGQHPPGACPGCHVRDGHALSDLDK